MTRLPTGVEPVNETMRTVGCASSASPATRPAPVRTFTTPSGMPAVRQSSASIRAVSGVISAGFSTMELPAAIAGMTFQTAICSG